jgi:hypothetical protein
MIVAWEEIERIPANSLKTSPTTIYKKISWVK